MFTAACEIITLVPQGLSDKDYSIWITQIRGEKMMLLTQEVFILAETLQLSQKIRTK